MTDDHVKKVAEDNRIEAVAKALGYRDFDMDGTYELLPIGPVSLVRAYDALRVHAREEAARRLLFWGSINEMRRGKPIYVEKRKGERRIIQLSWDQSEQLRTGSDRRKPEAPPWKPGDAERREEAENALEMTVKAAGELDLTVMRQQDEITELKTQLAQIKADAARLRDVLTRAIADNVWGAYYRGIEKDGKWTSGAMQDAEWLLQELGFPVDCQWHVADTIRANIPGLVEKLVARAASANDHFVDVQARSSFLSRP